MKHKEKTHIKVISNLSPPEKEKRADFHNLFKNCPIPSNELLSNLGIFLNRQTLSRILFMHELYKKIIPINGIVIEFGVRWGQNISLFSCFRGMYEPFNYSRKIIGFDTFAGFPSISPQDGEDEVVAKGSYGVTQDYKEYLESVLDYQEFESPLNHIKKYELVQGDAIITLEKYLKQHPETIIAFAYFDFDLYEPTKKCLELIKDHLTKGSIIGFDELNWPAFPGETLALKEVFGLARFSIRRSPLNPSPSYIVID